MKCAAMRTSACPARYARQNSITPIMLFKCADPTESSQRTRWFLELGMQTESLALVRKMLRSRSLTVQSFCASVQAVLIHADDLRRWHRTIEGARRKLLDGDNNAVYLWMFRFYVSMRDWPAAFPFLPATPQNAWDFLFSFWVYFELRRFKDCKRVIDKFRRYWLSLDAPDEFEVACFLEAFASFTAHAKRTTKAKRLWMLAAEYEIPAGKLSSNGTRTTRLPRWALEYSSLAKCKTKS